MNRVRTVATMRGQATNHSSRREQSVLESPPKDIKSAADVADETGATGVVVDTPMEVEVATVVAVPSTNADADPSAKKSKSPGNTFRTRPIPSTSHRDSDTLDNIQPMISPEQSTLSLSNSVRERAKTICEAFIKTHKEIEPLIAEQRQRLKDKWDEQLWAAACFRDYQLACVQKAFDAEIEQIEREYELERTHLKEKLLADLMEHRRRLTDNRDGGEEVQDGNGNGGGSIQSQNNNPGKGVQRRLRGKRTGDGAVEPRGAPGGKRRQPQGGIEDKSFMGAPDSDCVTSRIIYGIGRGGDIRRYGVDPQGGGRRTRNSANSREFPPRSSDGEQEEDPKDDVFARGDTLNCFGQLFGRGDSVTVGTPDSSELLGVISGIGSKDVWIRIDDGAKLKVTYQQLRSSRYALTRANPPS